MSRKFDITCKFCGTKKLKWRGKKLYDKDGAHYCWLVPFRKSPWYRRLWDSVRRLF